MTVWLVASVLLFHIGLFGVFVVRSHSHFWDYLMLGGALSTYAVVFVYLLKELK